MTEEPTVKCAYDEMVAMEQVIGNPRNPNRHPEGQIKALARIIRFQGWRAPVTISKRSGFVVRGHGRLEAAKLLGCAEVPVDYQDYANEAEEWADLIADNRIAELAEVDQDSLGALLKELDQIGCDMDLTGFDGKELDRILAETLEATGDGDASPEVEFSEELMESSNYVVLHFDNEIDWVQAVTILDLKQVRTLGDKEGFKRRKWESAGF